MDGVADEDPLLEVGRHGRVSPRVLGVAAYVGILRDDQIEGLVEPAVVALPVEEAMRPAVHPPGVILQFALQNGKRRDTHRIVLVILLVQDHNEGGSFDVVQTGLVDSRTEVGLSGHGPRLTVSGSQGSQEFLEAKC